MLHLTICDDEPAQRSFLEMAVRGWAAERKIEAAIESCQNAEQFLFRQEEIRADIVLLDIDMPGMDGLTLSRRLRERGEDVQIVFVTGLSDYVLEGYEVEAVSYLIKPVRKERLFACLDRARERVGKGEAALLLETAGGVARVKLRDVCYLESAAHDTQVRCVHLEERIRSKTGIRQLEERIGQESDAFFRIHRSYLVNLARVGRIARKEVVMDTGEILPVARGRWEELNRAYLAYYRGREAGQEL